MRICKHCNEQFDISVGAFANHVRWCDKNPKAIAYREANVAQGKHLSDIRFGRNKLFNVTCQTCSQDFDVKERELLFPTKERYFCSRKCANAEGGKAKSARHHTDEVAHYATVAWRYHEKRCVVCGEDKIVAVHHYDENHSNNDPKNLIPLCPTHHQYMHSRFKEDINNIVTGYIVTKWGQSVVGGTSDLHSERRDSSSRGSTR